MSPDKAIFVRYVVAVSLLVLGRVAQHALDDACAVRRRVGIVGANDRLDLREHDGSFGSRLRYDGQCADAFAVEIEGLGE